VNKGEQERMGVQGIEGGWKKCYGCEASIGEWMEKAGVLRMLGGACNNSDAT